MVTFLIGIAIAFCSNVAYSHDVGFHKKYAVEKSIASTIENSDVYTFDMPSAILNPETVTYERQWVSVDYTATPLPNHDLLPTKNLWLINCAIKFC